MNHGGVVTAVAVRPDGQRFASSGVNNNAKLWNATNGAQIVEMRGDIRAKNRVAKLTQQQADVNARLTASKATLTAAEAAMPTRATAMQTASAALTEVIPVIDKMAAKGIMHKNKAARHKSRLTAAVRAL